MPCVPPGVLERQGACAVGADALHPAVGSGRKRHLGAAVIEGKEPVEHQGGAVAQQCAGPAGLHRCQPPPLLGEADVADGVHTDVKAVEMTGSGPPLDRVVAQAAREELVQREHPLAPRPPSRRA
jgi:hypothetical protein